MTTRATIERRSELRILSNTELVAVSGGTSDFMRHLAQFILDNYGPMPQVEGTACQKGCQA